MYHAREKTAGSGWVPPGEGKAEWAVIAGFHSKRVAEKWSQIHLSDGQ